MRRRPASACLYGSEDSQQRERARHMEQEPALIPPSMTARLTIEHGFGSLFSLAFNPAGTLLVGGGAVSVGGERGATHGTVALWDAATGREVRRFEAQSAPVMSVAFSPNGQFLASASSLMIPRANARNAFMLWDVATGRELFVVTSVGIRGRSVAFNPTGDLVALAGLVAEHAVTMWDVASKTETRRLTGHTAPVNAVAFSHDGRLLAAGGDDHTLKVWEVATGQAMSTYYGWRAIHCVAFSPDDALLAAGDAYGGIRVWEVTTGQERYSLFGPADHTAYAVAFNDDGTLVAGAFGEEYSHFGSVLLWRIIAGTWRVSFTGITGAVMYAVAISPDGHTLASAGDEDLQLWHIT